jgi:hypothetical protein
MHQSTEFVNALDPKRYAQARSIVLQMRVNIVQMQVSSFFMLLKRLLCRSILTIQHRGQGLPLQGNSQAAFNP